ncbi:MAG: orotidine-5'-phosphate decarboxylase [Alphaproteobacteria bacterium]|nr:orotidine-5'-phosphate decarboxylase [Alphaproteobacteria bacterium]
MSSRIFCAIDTTDLNAGKALARDLKGHVAGIKLGLEFFAAHGPQGYKAIAQMGMPIFLDLKLHDIPNTVGSTISALLPLQPEFMTIHASGGAAMMKAAATAAAKAGEKRPKILAVTVLTSLNANDLNAVGQDAEPTSQVLRLAQLAKESGMDGVVCSPAEVAMLRGALGPDFILMVPGIRPVGADLGDQKRVMTPKDAIAAGTTYMVIGRPITGAPDPVAMARAINVQAEGA